MPDNWKDRNTGMRCETCVSYVPKTVKERGKDVLSGIGRCRALPPTMRGFPAVFESDWCGQHRIDENKI